jgi:hypothetical protein
MRDPQFRQRQLDGLRAPHIATLLDSAGIAVSETLAGLAVCVAASPGGRGG